MILPSVNSGLILQILAVLQDVAAALLHAKADCMALTGAQCFLGSRVAFCDSATIHGKQTWFMFVLCLLFLM
jgi:hypothetical protein